MKNTCAQSGKCQYCDEYIERHTPVQNYAAVANPDPRTNINCAMSGTGRHVLKWRERGTTKTQKTITGRSQSTTSIRSGTLLDTRP